MISPALSPALSAGPSFNVLKQPIFHSYLFWQIKEYCLKQRRAHKNTIENKIEANIKFANTPAKELRLVGI